MVIVIVVVVKCRGERPQKHPLETLDNIGLGLEFWIRFRVRVRVSVSGVSLGREP